MTKVTTFTKLAKVELTSGNVKERKYEVIISREELGGISLVLARTSSKKDAKRFLKYIENFK